MTDNEQGPTSTAHMADTVQRLRVAENSVDADLVAKLEATLARAKQGEIHSVAVAELLNDRCVATWWHKPANASLIALVGSASYLQFRMNSQFE